MLGDLAQVTFVGTVDNLLVSAMVPRNKESEIEEAFEEAETGHHHLLATLSRGEMLGSGSGKKQRCFLSRICMHVCFLVVMHFWLIVA